jgi:hypothetical protein
VANTRCTRGDAFGFLVRWRFDPAVDPFIGETRQTTATGTSDPPAASRQQPLWGRKNSALSRVSIVRGGGITVSDHQLRRVPPR